MANSRVIAVLLLLLGSRLCGPDGVQAQDSGGRASASPAREAAPPAGSGHRRPYVFFPRAAVETPPVEPFSAAERGNESQIDRVDIAPSTDLGVQAWGASESFSRSRMPQTIPVQYPLDNSVYEGETPLGEDPAKTPPEGSWRDSSVDRPAEELPVEDQPWVEWYKFTMQAQSLPGGGDKGFGMTSIDMKGTLKFARWPFLFVTPRAGFHFLNGPSTTDVPARLYDFSLDTTVYLPLNDRWTITGSAAPSLYSDLQALQNSFRMVGRGLVFYRWSSELQLAGGFVYLGRKDIVALPVAGFIYTPNDDVKYDIMFPKPRIGYRYQHRNERERWVYASGELGGGSWAVQRASGANDIVSYRDYELLLGIEHKEPKAVNWQLEGGFVFGRKLQYFSKLGDTTLPSTAVLRVVLSY